MQSLYTIEAQEKDWKPGETTQILQKHLEETRELYVYLVYFMTELARYSERDASLRASKHLPTEEDLNVNIKLAGNEVLWRILEDNSFKLALDEFSPQNINGTADLVRKLYQEMTETEIYRKYISEEGREKKSERQIMEFVFNDIMLPNELFISQIEEHFSNWDDDAEMLQQMVLQYIARPGNSDFQNLLTPEKREFGFTLLRTVLEKREQTMELIRPRLKNWDSERIAVLDMLLMQMGICEFLYFETIPPKVTINEYIDLAKEYSTPQSGQFVNGILDNIHKELVSQNKLHKVNFR